MRIGDEAYHELVAGSNFHIADLIKNFRFELISPTAESSPTQRDEHLAAIERDGVFAWKRTSGYYTQSRAENAFSRFKRIFGDHLQAKRDESQERETMIACGLLNRMQELGRPQSYPVR